MNAASHDPLSRLPPDHIPEPSAARMEETIAAAQQLFARQSMRRPDKERKRPFFGRTWMEAILGAGLASTAAALAFVLAPALISVPTPQSEPPPAEPYRMGMQPNPPGRPLDLDLVAPLELRQFGEVGIGVRNAGERFGIYVVQPSGVEQELVSGPKAAAETISVTDALLVGAEPADILVVRSGFGELQRWEAFVHDGFGFTVSAALSRQIWDAEGREAVLERLGLDPGG